jgi:hypothetical protein
MSSGPTSRSPDLRRLVEEGYELEILAGYLVIHHVPYVTPAKEVAYGTLVSELTLAGDMTATPATHTIRFAGQTPCDAEGQPLRKVINSAEHVELGSGITADFVFSQKPSSGYPDYHAKITAYVRMLGTPAAALDPSATAATFRVVERILEGSPFRYEETASARVGIGAATDKLRVDRIAIIGVGGTGSYVLDLISKVPVREIHLFDGDRFLTHNAFRSPGAASVEELDGGPNKAEHFAAVYGAMRTGLVAHPYQIDESNLDELKGMDAVFICMDPSAAKRALIERLEALETPFFDTGIGAYLAGDAIGGQVRITSGLPGSPVSDRRWISFAEAGKDIYADNIQVADLNALAAALAVVRWKRLRGFYLDLEHEQHSIFTINGNTIDNEVA